MIERGKHIKPSRIDTLRGAQIPPWLFRVGLNPTELIVWAVMARCAGSGLVLTRFTAARLGAIAGLSPWKVRDAIASLEEKELLSVTTVKGQASKYRFRAHPLSIAGNHQGQELTDQLYLTWSRLVLIADNPEGSEYWREW